MAQSSSGGLTVNGFSVPLILYGTAWKEDRTEALVELALKTGYRGIDTANQRRHYFEEGVGQAVQKAIASGLCRREELFLQTKFTYLGGQDHRLPYDPRASLATQVRQSMQSSLEHLGTDHVDSYVLHGPSSGVDWCPDDAEVWQAMSELKRAGQTRLLGVSNINLRQLHALCKGDGEKPSFVQNRCYAQMGWDRPVRAFCKERGIVYQSFSLLTANPQVVGSREAAAIARRLSATPAQVVLRFAQQLGMLPLTGTTNADHLRHDLECGVFELTAEEIGVLESHSG